MNESVDLGRTYVEQWFWTLDQLARSAGIAKRDTLDLISAGCAPGPIYIADGNGDWWSAIDETPRPEGSSWYSRSAAWGLRRAALAVRGGASAADAAQAERTSFIGDFVTSLAAMAGAEEAFGDCFANGAVAEAAAARRAAQEWESWLDGGYGVCLRSFTARTCIGKESLGASLKAALAAGSPDHTDLLRKAEELASLMLPFAPWQRERCTPGQTIDRLLSRLRLGGELHYI